MNRRLYCWVVLGLLGVAFAATLPGCDDMGYANDVVNLHEKERAERGIPKPTELPPGLGDDLPAPATQPQLANQ